MSGEIHIRRATVDDAAGVAAVMNGVIAEGGLTLFDRPFSDADERAFIASLGARSALLVAVRGGRICGVQSVDLFAPAASATSMHHVATMGTWLAEDARGHGIGRRLATDSFQFALVHGYTKVIVQVLAGNARALRFYRGLGFEDIGVARRHVALRGAFHDEVYLERFLESAPHGRASI
jgi:phosphinothricin acetyltransferase